MPKGHGVLVGKALALMRGAYAALKGVMIANVTNWKSVSYGYRKHGSNASGLA